MSAEDKMDNLMAAMTPETIAAIRADLWARKMFIELGNAFIVASLRAQGSERLIECQEILLKAISKKH